jgi:hypothetical protein
MCSYTENTQMNLYICTENMLNSQKVDYLSKFKTKIENILGLLSEAQMGLFGQTLFKPKNLVQMYL